MTVENENFNDFSYNFISVDQYTKSTFMPPFLKYIKTSFINTKT